MKFGMKSETVPLVFREYGKKPGDPWTHPLQICTAGENSVVFPCGNLHWTSPDRRYEGRDSREMPEGLADRSTTLRAGPLLQIIRRCLLSHGIFGARTDADFQSKTSVSSYSGR